MSTYKLYISPAAKEDLKDVYKFGLCQWGKARSDNYLASYRMTSKVNWYGSFWANYVLDDFHNAVLVMIKNRNEKKQQGS